jgi:hypothetical protein
VTLNTLLTVSDSHWGKLSGGCCCGTTLTGDGLTGSGAGVDGLDKGLGLGKAGTELATAASLGAGAGVGAGVDGPGLDVDDAWPPRRARRFKRI